MTTTATAPEPTVDTVEIVPSFIRDSWWTPDAGSAAGAASVLDASTGELLAKVSTEGLDLAAVVDYGRTTGQAELGKLTFHQRALKLKELAQYLNGRREEFYALSAQTGATKIDSMVDIDGGIGVLFTFGSKGRRELPNAQVIVDGPMEVLSKDGSFAGEHIYTRIPGVAVQINAFNFPVWGMLEKLAPAFIAGVPTIVKPATPTGYVTAAVVKAIDRIRHPAQGLAAADLRLGPHHAGPPRLPRPRGLHRLRVHRQHAQVPRQRGQGRGPLHLGNRLPERLDPGPGRRQGHPGIRRLHQVPRHRDDRQGRPEVHLDPPGHRAAGAGAGRRHRRGGADPGARCPGRPARRGRQHGRPGVPGAARRCARGRPVHARRRRRTRVRHARFAEGHQRGRQGRRRRRRRLYVPGAAELGRSGSRRGPLAGGLRPGVLGDRLHGPGRRRPPRRPRRRLARRLGLHQRPRRRPRTRHRHRRPPRPRAHAQPRGRPQLHRPRFTGPAPGPRRPGPRRRRRGARRHPLRAAPHAAHRHPGLTEHADRGHRRLAHRRRPQLHARDRGPAPVPEAPEHAAHRGRDPLRSCAK